VFSCSGEHLNPTKDPDIDVKRWYQHEVLNQIGYVVVTFVYFLVGALVFCKNETITIDCEVGPKQVVIYGVNPSQLNVNQTEIQFYFSSLTIDNGLRAPVTGAGLDLPLGLYSEEVEPCSRAPTFVEGLYWGAATLTGVGYGDLSPSTDGMKEFTIVYIVFGFGVVLTILTISASAVLSRVQRFLLMRLDDDPTDDRQPHCWKIILSFLLVATMVLVGALFFAYEEDWEFSDALYFTVVTSTCVGYGDLLPTSQGSKLFSFFYMLISSSFVLFGLSNFGNIMSDMDLERRRREVLNRQVNVEMILAQDLSGDSKVSEGEYLAGFLEEMEIVTPADVVPVLRRFKLLDKDGSGFLDMDDVIAAHEESESMLNMLSAGDDIAMSGNHSKSVASAFHDAGIPLEQSVDEEVVGACFSITSAISRMNPKYCCGADDNLEWLDNLKVLWYHFLHLCMIFVYFYLGTAIIQQYEVIIEDCSDALTFSMAVEGVATTFTQDDVPQCSRSWTTWEGLYFSAVTVMTVGYGDYSVTTDEMRMFMIFYILIGIALVGSIMLTTGMQFCDWIQTMVLRMVGTKRLKTRHLIRVITSVLMICIVIATGVVFFMSSEGWGYLDATYWVIVTTATVGYGDMSLNNTPNSHIFSFFYVLISTTFVASSVKTIVNVYLAHEHTRRRDHVLSHMDDIETLLMQDQDGDAAISEGEYLSIFLKKMGITTEHDTIPVLERFRVLDVDGSHFLDKNDLDMAHVAELSVSEDVTNFNDGSTSPLHANHTPQAEAGAVDDAWQHETTTL
jgi:hypothetical protein